MIILSWINVLSFPDVIVSQQTQYVQRTFLNRIAYVSIRFKNVFKTFFERTVFVGIKHSKLKMKLRQLQTALLKLYPHGKESLSNFGFLVETNCQAFY